MNITIIDENKILNNEIGILLFFFSLSNLNTDNCTG